MANKHRGEVEILLDQTRKLRYTTNALAELEDALGKPVTQLNQEETGIKTIRAMLWAGLLHETPDLTINEAGELMNHTDLTTISEKVTEAITLAFGGENSKKNKKSGLSGVGSK